jgi:endonuclease/exonuclease/phosphatase family metal-dependent hydrolase
VNALCIVAALALCGARASFALTVLSYNVENLFDDVRDGSEYHEFDPARGTWNGESFLLRIKALAEVFRRSVPGGPDVLLLQEVENAHALQVLVTEGARGMGYSWRALVPKNGLAANVAVVSRIPIARVRTHAVGPWRGSKNTSVPARDILEAQIEISGRTLFLFNNHWKSKTEGARATEPSRLESASVLARRIAEILSQDPGADIVAAGDMNENVDEDARAGRRYVTALAPARDAGRAPQAAPGIFLADAYPPSGGYDGRGVLFDPWFEMEPAGRGSYAWHGAWLTVDHMLLSAGLFDGQGFTYRRSSFTVLKSPFLLDERGLPRAWSDRRGRNGFSDHLPILLTLDVDR